MDAPEQTTTRDSNSLMERLFAAGAHFGFSKSRRHPTAAPYLFGAKQRTDVFDLEKTSVLLVDAAAYLRALGKAGKTVLVVGTKEEAKKLVEETAVRAEMPYVVNRWIGGMLTNFSEIGKRRARLADLESQQESGELDRKYTKHERLMLGREAEKLAFNFGGIRTMDRLPDALLVVDPRHEEVAVREAKVKGIPVVAVMGSDCDAGMIAKPVYVNDAHRASLALALGELADAFVAGRAEIAPPPAPVSAEG